MSELKTSQDPEQDFSTKLAEVILRVRTHNANAYKAAEIVANMVREHDAETHDIEVNDAYKKGYDDGQKELMTFKANERAKTKAECREAVEQIPTASGAHVPVGVTLQGYFKEKALKAIDEV